MAAAASKSMSTMRPRVRLASTGASITDYRWIIEEDRTFHVDQNAVNTGAPVPSLGTNFHTSYMPVVAAGCVGTYACETGQTVFDPSSGSHVPTVCDMGDGACERTGPAAAGSGRSQLCTPGLDQALLHLDPTRRCGQLFHLRGRCSDIRVRHGLEPG